MSSFFRFSLVVFLMFSSLSVSFAESKEAKKVISSSNEFEELYSELEAKDLIVFSTSSGIAFYITLKLISIFGDNMDAAWYYALEHVFEPDLVQQFHDKFHCLCFGCFNVQIGVLPALGGLIKAGGLMFSNYVSKKALIFRS